ncbi:hypothetical protein GGP91_000275 [Salinibacter ruber]|uniref:Uncharacterized protein n=3 Tax=Salinibacter ruber TaxID=146919 RepID=Q2S4B6_SALRD|nr:hypothetical protein [Salinibacter ruber]ABC44042.1 hypothetical protein SRU_0830 [Salinibacter ruber DSM 13855]MBB4061903.1 hypothetical protein [Salinibacter ruber]MCS3650797.1 hypothetical protein [Salinibacter ruber]MCS3654051.1 hypothetical protein [Salinibacter ruber]MCS3661845.1 hypothetical protein [Salinibacter ruber]
MTSPSVYVERLSRFALVVGAAVAAGGLVIDAMPADLPIRLGDATGGIAMAYVGGGLTMVAGTALAGRRVFADASRPNRTPDGT